MLWQRETQQTTKICWCGNCSATRSHNACLPAPQGLSRLWGCLRSPCLTRRALPHSLPFFLFALSPFPPLPLLSAALSMWKQPSCLSLHGAALCHPLHHLTQEGNKRLSQQPWRRRIRCAGMEQPVPVFQQRFNLPLAYKQQMFVQLTCKQETCIAAGPRRPGAGEQGQAGPGCSGHPRLSGWSQGMMLGGAPSCPAAATSLLLPWAAQRVWSSHSSQA